MNVIGIDLGTTTISIVVMDRDTGGQLHSVNIPNPGGSAGAHTWERLQDAAAIIEVVLELTDVLTSRYAPVAAIGITGQMHGIVYLDADGRAVSPLYTWQDRRGDLLRPDGVSWAQYLSNLTGYTLSSGFGLVTHAWNVAHAAVPEGSVKICSIYGFLAMRLARRSTPLLHASDAASFGLFDVPAGRFDLKAVQAAGIDPQILPEVTPLTLTIGESATGIPISIAIGDNQASFLGSVTDIRNGILLNVGTGAQISVYADAYAVPEGCETRPLVDGRYLMVGSSLSGGHAYALLERFFRDCGTLAGASCDSLYERMNELARSEPKNPLRFCTSFCGKRNDPKLRASITNLGEDNFTPAAFTRALLVGLAEELYGYYACMLPHLQQPPSLLVCSGNAVRRNPALQDILAKVFGMPVTLCGQVEEAATGAARFALATLGGAAAWS